MSEKYQVEVTPQAEEQIFQIAWYIIEEFQAPETAAKVLDRLEKELNRLEYLPERILLLDEEPWHSRGIHKYVIGNYIAYFVISEPDRIVRVTSVVMEKMNQKKQLKKMEIPE